MAAIGDSRNSNIATGKNDGRRLSHQYPTRGTSSSHSHTRSEAGAHVDSTAHRSRSKASIDSMLVSSNRPQKHVTFQHLLPDPHQCARLPMRVMISPHDTTESIIATVKNFFGLYGPGINFQDRHRNILIAAYDNFENDMTVYVRETATESVPISAHYVPATRVADPRAPAASERPKLGMPFEMRPPAQVNKLTIDTNSHDHSSASSSAMVSSASTARPRSRTQKSHDSAGAADAEANDYTDSDGDASVTSSRRSKAEAHVSAEISVDNIVEGGRRKRAKFESFELPLFVPPQVSAGSACSISPQRRAPGLDNFASPLPLSNQRSFVYNQAVPSPQSFGRGDGQYTTNGSSYGIYAQQQRGRGAINYYPPRQATGGILPTPEPTNASVISDEDVALQLMRLGDSVSHGRTSTSTADDTFSRKADAASSDEDETGARRRTSGRHDLKTTRSSSNAHNASAEYTFSSEAEYSYDESKGREHPSEQSSDFRKPASRKSSKSKVTQRPSTGGSVVSATESARSVNASNKFKGPNRGPMSPVSLDSSSGRMSLASTSDMAQDGEDKEDLSSKPRCQRCRKSKKGCDRQRPCGRCKDAGIGIDGCVCEDEQNGRKGRYGRIMGVVVKKEDPGYTHADDVTGHSKFLTQALPVGEKSKKRKR